MSDLFDCEVPDQPAPPSGAAYEISLGSQRATIVEVGGAIRSYSVDGRDVFVPWDEDTSAPVFNGGVLLPWPNRLRGGSYLDADGNRHQLAHSEPDRDNALHGLACAERWSLVAQTPTSITLELALPAQRGWPFQLVTRVRYSLSDDGLEVEATTRNVGTGKAPYGIGFHPWLSPGDANLDDCTVRVDAATHVIVDYRLLPIDTEPVTGEFDLRSPTPAAELNLDDAWIDPIRDYDGISWMKLGCPDGRTPAVWMDETMTAWQACTGNHIEGYTRRGLAAEPMTCVADAFNTGEGLKWLAPGEAHSVRWGAALL